MMALVWFFMGVAVGLVTAVVLGAILTYQDEVKARKEKSEDLVK